MDRQTLRDWVIRYNVEGVGGLSDRTSPGPKSRLTPEQAAAVAELVREGPDLAKAFAVVNGGDKLCQMAARKCTSRVKRKGL
jgi:transposase